MPSVPLFSPSLRWISRFTAGNVSSFSSLSWYFLQEKKREIRKRAVRCFLCFVFRCSWFIGWRVYCAIVPGTLAFDLPYLVFFAIILFLFSVSQEYDHRICTNVARMKKQDGHRVHWVKELLIVCWATGKRLTDHLTKLSLMTLSPPQNCPGNMAVYRHILVIPPTAKSRYRRKTKNRLPPKHYRRIAFPPKI